MSLASLNTQQFGARTKANENAVNTNGQSDRSTASGDGTTTVIAVKGSAPSISTRSS
ncbi:hypothetical protein ACFYP4_02870 [Streptomyces sp. NPDC005551]|uniref:hypothetical protein n=1 Tax=Streptomyces sp. NPDC005551 TaxID=3364725 RepID=UPI0036C93B0F